MESCTAFNSNECVCSGDLLQVTRKAKEIIDRDELASILIFDDTTSEIVEVDFRGTMEDVLERLEKTTVVVNSVKAPLESEKRLKRGPGRPKLGVVSREVTLLPRHWDWLKSQSGGASVTLRKLVEEARRLNSGKDKVRYSQEVAFRFMSAMAGDFPGFEEATRALFAGDSERFNSLVASWSIDIRDYALKLAGPAFDNPV